MPWRDSKADFYRIWLSEIMLQQTRVEAVIPYYNRFLERFPTVETLAAAPDDAVLATWSGLGYYSRARNLHRAAKALAGVIPTSYQEVLALPGVGPYTAAAIASIALDLPHAAVDGNVIRVIARLTNDASEITSSAVRHRFSEEAERLLDPQRPGDFNQAMMELGATVCTPRTPDCGACPVTKHCGARAAGRECQLPVKLKPARANDVRLDLAIVERDGCVLLLQRSAVEKRLAGFWELPAKALFPRQRSKKLAEFRHQIVNDRFSVTVWRIPDAGVNPEGASWVTAARLKELPLTTMTRKALNHPNLDHLKLDGPA